MEDPQKKQESDDKESKLNSSTESGTLKKDEENDAEDEEEYSIEELEKLLWCMCKIFLLNFPLYMIFKKGIEGKFEETTSSTEVSQLSMFCDIHDSEIPTHLLRNVVFFIKHGGIQVLMHCFEGRSPEELPLSIAQSLVTIFSNLKLWLSFRATVQFLAPLRSQILRYMCRMKDSHLKSSNSRNNAGKLLKLSL